MPKTLSESELGAFRERVCDVAEQMFDEQGLEGVTMRELADALGVSSMTPYRYFKDKDAILAAVRVRAFSRFASAMEAAGAAVSEHGWAQSAFAYLDFALANAAAYRMMFDTDQPSADRYPELVAASERARATMSARLRQAQAEGEPVRGDLEVWSHAIWAVLHGAVMLELSGKLRGKLTARDIALPALAAIAKQIGIRVEAKAKSG